MLPLPVRLACVKHAASVRSEPGSNSQVHLVQSAETNQTQQTKTQLNQLDMAKATSSPHKAYFNVKQLLADTSINTSFELNQSSRIRITIQPNQPTPNQHFPTNLMNAQSNLAAQSITQEIHQSAPKAPPTYPFHSRYKCQRTNDGELRFY